jgi:hypothetical protein
MKLSIQLVLSVERVAKLVIIGPNIVHLKTNLEV